MKIYTIKDEDGVIRPKAMLELPKVMEVFRDGKIVTVDCGMEAILEYIESKHGKGCSVVVCELTVIK